jgi:two-component system response regulator HydG
VVIVITAHGSVEAAVEAMRAGAFDFVTKPIDPEELLVKLDKALAQRRLSRDLERMSARLDTYEADDARRQGLDEMVGRSEPMRRIYGIIEKVAPSDSTVLVLGESGTGKELVARAIHRLSARARGPFVGVHCTAYAEGVLESELFGHERNAFTGAAERRIGRFELADGGSLFLDEVGDIPPAVQTKLLRVLQERELERVGGTQTVRVDIRIISATNRNLEAAIGAGLFREDLFYRLNVMTIELPPLRERRDDIPLLVEAFVRRESGRLGREVLGPTPRALEAMEGYNWPGNVRELRNVIERAAVLAGSEPIDLAHLPPMLAPSPSSYVPLPEHAVDFDQEVERYERRLILHAYEKAGRVKAKAAKMLGIDRNRFRYKLEKLGIEDR